MGVITIKYSVILKYICVSCCSLRFLEDSQTSSMLISPLRFCLSEVMPLRTDVSESDYTNSSAKLYIVD